MVRSGTNATASPSKNWLSDAAFVNTNGMVPSSVLGIAAPSRTSMRAANVAGSHCITPPATEPGARIAAAASFACFDLFSVVAAFAAALAVFSASCFSSTARCAEVRSARALRMEAVLLVSVKTFPT